MLLLLTPRMAAERSSAVSSTRRAAVSLHLLHRCKEGRRRTMRKEGARHWGPASKQQSAAHAAACSVPARCTAAPPCFCPKPHISRCRVMRRRYCSGMGNDKAKWGAPGQRHARLTHMRRLQSRLNKRLSARSHRAAAAPHLVVLHQLHALRGVLLVLQAKSAQAGSRHRRQAIAAAPGMRVAQLTHGSPNSSCVVCSRCLRWCCHRRRICRCLGTFWVV